MILENQESFYQAIRSLRCKKAAFLQHQIRNKSQIAVVLLKIFAITRNHNRGNQKMPNPEIAWHQSSVHQSQLRFVRLV